MALVPKAHINVTRTAVQYKYTSLLTSSFFVERRNIVISQSRPSVSKSIRSSNQRRKPHCPADRGVGPLAGSDVAGNTCRLLRQFSAENPGFLFQCSIPTF